MTASHVLTLTQLENLFWAATVSITDFDPDKVRISYLSTNQPAWDIDQDVTFINVMPQDNAWDKKREYLEDTTNDDFDQVSVFYTRVFQVSWVNYGPNSYDTADLIRHGLLMEDIRGPLKNQWIAPIPEIPAPIRVPELFNGQWWQRADLNVMYNVATLRTNEVPYLQAARIEIHDDHGLERVIAITE